MPREFHARLQSTALEWPKKSCRALGASLRLKAKDSVHVLSEALAKVPMPNRTVLRGFPRESVEIDPLDMSPRRTLKCRLYQERDAPETERVEEDMLLGGIDERVTTICCSRFQMKLEQRRVAGSIGLLT